MPDESPSFEGRLPTLARELWAELEPDVWVELESVVKRFEQAWRRGEQPEIEAFLPTEGAARPAILFEIGAYRPGIPDQGR
jgi:hypothetical protein